MGKILVGLDKTNPAKYIILIENNEGSRIVFGCTDTEFDSFIEKLKEQREIARSNRSNSNNNNFFVDMK